MKTLVFLAALCFGIAFTATPIVVLAANDGDFNTARATFLKGTAGDSGAIKDAADQFAALVKSEPSNPAIIAYHGAAITMRARDAWFPWTKMSYSEEGLAEIDRALVFIKPQHETTLTGGVPTAMQAKFVAANTFLAVPSFMNRHAQGEKLLNEVLAMPSLTTSPAPFRKAVYGSALRYVAASHPQQVPAWQREVAQPANVQASAR
jgi:hypothetical protein